MGQYFVVADGESLQVRQEVLLCYTGSKADL